MDRVLHRNRNPFAVIVRYRWSSIFPQTFRMNLRRLHRSTRLRIHRFRDISFWVIVPWEQHKIRIGWILRPLG